MDLASILKGRRSIRKYKKDPIAREILEEILTTALWAPSGMNLQNWEIYVVGGKTRDQIATAVSRAKSLIEPAIRELFPDKIVQFTMQFFTKYLGRPLFNPCLCAAHSGEHRSRHEQPRQVQRRANEVDQFSKCCCPGSEHFNPRLRKRTGNVLDGGSQKGRRRD
nr:nitroreductase family protein [Desulfofundulus thermobenzoicus]